MKWTKSYKILAASFQPYVLPDQRDDIGFLEDSTLYLFKGTGRISAHFAATL